MRKQPRSSNNPANPLYKVASLDIKRTNERAAKRRSCDVSVTLNFKKSNDLRGQTVDQNGKDITVNFTLAIKRATFEIKLLFENVADINQLKVSNVAFVDSLSTNRSVQIVEKSNSANRSHLSAQTALFGDHVVSSKIRANPSSSNDAISMT